MNNYNNFLFYFFPIKKFKVLCWEESEMNSSQISHSLSDSCGHLTFDWKSFSRSAVEYLTPVKYKKSSAKAAELIGFTLDVVFKKPIFSASGS